MIHEDICIKLTVCTIARVATLALVCTDDISRCEVDDAYLTHWKSVSVRLSKEKDEVHDPAAFGVKLAKGGIFF